MDKTKRNDTTIVVNDGYSTTIINEDVQKTRVIPEIDNNKTIVQNIKNHTTKLINSIEATKDDSHINIMNNVNGYEITKVLSDTSGESTIYLCQKDENTFVLKLYKRNLNVNFDKANEINKINSKYLLKFIENGTYNNQYYEILPYYKNGTLLDNLDRLTNDFIKDVVVYEMNEALKSMHNAGFFHNDIKPSNIFLTDDFKHIVLGDFGISSLAGGRQYVTNIGNMTEIYAAPESGETNSVKTDYFSFGMTLYHLGYHGNPFKGISSHKFRLQLLNNQIYIPEKIDIQLRGLIIMLIRYSPMERISSEGVESWLKNKNVYEAVTKGTGDVIPVSIDPYRFNRKTYTNALDLADALIVNWSMAKDHLENGLIESIFKRNVDEMIDLKKYMNSHTLDETLFVFLTKIKPSIRFVYDNYIFDSWIDYLVCIREKYYTTPTLLVSVEYLKLAISRFGLNEEVEKLVCKILDSNAIYDNYHLDLILNLFETDGRVYYNGNVYSNLKEYVLSWYGDNLNIHTDLLFGTNMFKDILIKNFHIEKSMFESCNNKTKLNFSFLSNSEAEEIFFSKNILGYISFKKDNFVFKNIDEIVKYTKIAYEGHNKKHLDIVNRLFIDKIILLYLDLYSDIKSDDYKIVNLVYNNVYDKNYSELFYFYSVKDSKFYIGKKGILNLTDLINYLLIDDNYDDFLKKNYNMAFKNWAAAKGYKI